jgi:tripartite-type tricarboxylate transporter receptor subunit TctC
MTHKLTQAIPMLCRPAVYTAMLTAGLCMTAVQPAQAQGYPNKPITLIVPFTPGGTTDIIGRIVADGLSKRLGQSVIIDNRGGAGGNIGAAAAAQAKPDGYTLLMGYNGTNAINPSLYKKLAWDPIKSFDPISMVARVNNVVIVNPALPIKTMPDLLAFAKAHPGEVNYGSAGAGSIFHLAGEMLAQQTGVRMTHVPYKGAAPALTDLMGGQVQVMFSTIPAALSFIKAGKLRALAVTGQQRSPLFPELPTAHEAGFPAMVVDSWFAVFAPKGLPADVQASLNKAVREVIADPVTIRKMEEQGAQPMGSTAAELADLLTKDIKSWHIIVNSAKVTLD